MIILSVPDAGSNCNVELTTSGVSFTAKDPNYFDKKLGYIPDAEALSKVVASAVDLFGNERAACEVRKDPAGVASTLLRLAETTRATCDGKDSEGQTLQHLWTLHFQERQKELTWWSTYKFFKVLAQDFMTVEQFQSMSVEKFEQESKQIEKKTDFGIKGLFHYYKGLARWGPRTDEARPRALILTCSFGGGHKSAANAVKSYLGSAGFDSIIRDTTWDAEFKDVGIQIQATAFNDFILKQQLYSVVTPIDALQKMMGPLAKPCPSPSCNTARKNQFRTAVLDQRPDLIVTVYHMELLPVLEVAKDLGNLPVLHISTDIDIKMSEIFHQTPVYPRFLVSVPFNLQPSYKTIAPLKKSQTFLSGYPVREEFLKPANPAHVSAERSKLVPKGTKVLLVMSGGGGQDVKWPYKLVEAGIGQPLHIIIIAGGNNELSNRLRKAMPGNVTFPDGRTVWQDFWHDTSVTVEVARDSTNTRTDKPFYVFAAKLALLMDMADVVLTKPGGGSTAEVAYRGLPAIFDLSYTLMPWEQFTVDNFVQQKRAVIFKEESEFRGKLLSAMELGRSLKLTKDGKGHFINSASHVIKAAKTLVYKTECWGCSVLADETYAQ